MSRPKFKKGDWCFCEFKLQQVQEVTKGRVTEVSDGHFRHGGNDLSDRCAALTMRNKMISDDFKYWSDKLYALNNNALNYPDLHRELVDRWVTVCGTTTDAVCTQLLKDLSEFCEEVIKEVAGTKVVTVKGVRLFR
jgi:hypothetical protein